MKSISKKIMLSFFLCTFLIAAVILLTFNIVGNKIIKSEISDKNEWFLESQVQKMNQLFGTSEQMVEALSSLITEGLDYDRFIADEGYAAEFMESRKNLLVNFSKRDQGLMGIYTYFDPELSQRIHSLWYVRNDATGEMELSSDDSVVSDFVRSNEDLVWYYGAIDAKGLFWTPLYVDSDLGVAMISCTYPLYFKDQIIGMVGVDINFSSFSEALANMKMGESGFAAMIDQDGTVLSHPNIEQEENLALANDGFYKSLYESMISTENGNYHYQLNGKAHVVSYTKASNGKYFMFDMLESEMYQQLSGMQFNMILITGIGIVLALLFSYFLGKSIGGPITALSHAAEQLAIGDIDVKIDIKSKDEIGQLVTSFMKMTDNIKNNIVVMEAIAKGSLEVEVHVKSDKDEQSKAMIQMIEAIQALIKDMDEIAAAAVAGNLDQRGNVQSHGGDYGQIILGVNRILDAVIVPIKEAAGVLKEMSNGNLKVRVVGNYKGDHAEIKDSLNGTLDALSKYVDEISYVLMEMANANFNLEVKSEYKGDFIEIKNALNEIIHALNQVLGDINRASDLVASGAKQVSDSGLSLSHGAVEQATSIDDLTLSLNRIADQTKHSAVSANLTSDAIHQTKEKVHEGNRQMQGLLESIGEISDSSHQISNVIKLIEEIAFQTNILALNAAVEAARAGEQGKGFAVVADEVRNLASRSAVAAKESTVMIENSLSKVDHGTALAHETADILSEILTGIHQATGLVEDIASAANIQASEISRINLGIEQLSRVIQTNSAASEESASASEELLAQASNLKSMVSQFKMNE